MNKPTTLYSKHLIGLYIDWTGEGELNIYTISNNIFNARRHLKDKALRLYFEDDTILYAIKGDQELSSHLEYKDLDPKDIIYTIHPKLRNWLFTVKFYRTDFIKLCKKLKTTQTSLKQLMSGQE